jgi:hypothetical protein
MYRVWPHIAFAAASLSESEYSIDEAVDFFVLLLPLICFFIVAAVLAPR